MERGINEICFMLFIFVPFSGVINWAIIFVFEITMSNTKLRFEKWQAITNL